MAQPMYSKVLDDDGYLSKYKCIPSSHHGAKQNTSPQYELKGVIFLKRDDDDCPLKEIQKCIGQVLSWYGETDSDGNKSTYGGTATVYKRLRDGYYLLITCAHNLGRYNGDTTKAQNAKRSWYLPEGEQNMDIICNCIHSIKHDSYNPKMMHCPNDIAIVLCYDQDSYFKNVDPNACVHLTAYKGKKNKVVYCHIDGYPSVSGGKIMGMIGNALLDAESGEWKYTNLYTYPGQSGSVIYNIGYADDDVHVEKEHYYVYGIHTFGNTDTQKNRGVYLAEAHIKWIEDKEHIMEQKAAEHHKVLLSKKAQIEQKKTDTEEQSAPDVQTFLESLGVGQSCYSIFAKEGCSTMDDLRFVEKYPGALKEMGIPFFSQKKILDGLKIHFEKQKTDEDDESKSEHDVQGLVTIDRDEINSPIYDCIGQIITDFGDSDNETRGTGIVIKKLSNYHWVVLTSVMMVQEYSKATGETEEADAIWFYPRGRRKDRPRKCRLKYVSHQIYNEYKPEIEPCPGDVAVVLFKDTKGATSGEGTKHLNGVEVNEVVQISEWKSIEKTADLNIYGYPVKSKGALQGSTGEAKWTERGFWVYNIHTYPGVGGAPIFEKIHDEKTEKYGVYGIHTWGNVDKQQNCGVFLDSPKVEWIEQKVAEYQEECTK